MNTPGKIRSSTLGVIISLVISVGWIFMGLDIGFRFEASDLVSQWLTLGGYRHTIATILALALIPVCALEKRWGFLAVLALGITTLTLSATHVIYMVVATPAGYESQLFGPLIWTVIQVPVIVFSQRAGKELA